MRVRWEEQVEDPSVMVSVAALCSALAVVSTLIGLPLTLIRRSSLERPLNALFDSFATGLVTLLVGMTVLNWLGGIWFAVIVLGLIGLITVTLVRQGVGGLPALGWTRPGTWTLATIMVLAGATLIRLRSVNYISRGGDYGGYVNWANQYARTGVLESGFPPLFSIYLGLTSRVFGFANTTATVPLLGILLLLATLRLLSQLDVHASVRVAAVILVGLHTHAVWYSSFPMSEALQAPLVVIVLSNVVAIVRSGEDHLPVGEMVSLAIMALAIGLCRVTAPVLVLPLVLLVAASAVRPWRAFTSRLALATAATTLGVTGGYLYGLTEIRPYYVGNQIGGTLPASVVDKLNRFDLLIVSPVLLGLATLGVLAFVGIAWLTRPGTRWVASTAETAIEPEPGTETKPDDSGNRLGERLSSWGWWPLPITVALVLVGKVLTDRATPGDVGPQLHRIGYPLVVAAGLALLVPRALRGARGLAAIFGAIIGLVMVQVNVSRFDVPQNHTHFLYWDRYVFSEVFPMLVVIVALGATGVLEWSRERWPDHASGRVALPVLIVGAVPLLLAAATSLVTLDTVRAMNYQETFDNGYELERDIVALMPDKDQPVLWTASAPTAPKDFPFPNTWYALGVPLQMSWGRDVVNVDPSKDVFTAERVIPPRLIASTARCSPDSATYVVEIETGGPALDRRIDDSDLTINRLGRVAYELPTLTQPQGPGWKYADVVANVYEVTTVSSAEVDCTVAP